jgi:hypothetical protein
MKPKGSLTAFKTARLPVSILSQIEPVHAPHTSSQLFILILFSHLRLGLPSGLLPSGVPTNAL